MRALSCLCILAALCANAEARPRGGTPIPAGASANGYTINTFHTGPFTTSNVDTTQTYHPGYQWYFPNYFGPPQSPSALTINPDGSVTMAGTGNDTLGSLGLIVNATPYHGTGFGCGAYITAEMSFPGIFVSNGHAGQSITLYLMALEHLVYPQGASEQAWAAQPPPYDHFIEIDTIEFNTGQTYGSNYSGTLHDWYGDYNVTCPGAGYCGIDNRQTTPTNIFVLPGLRVNVEKNTDFTLFHRYATLWVPATSLTNGILAFYFDDILINEFQYTQFTTQPPPPGVPPSQIVPWTWGIVDNQHLGLILGGTVVNPLTVRSVDVWQNANACNLTN